MGQTKVQPDAMQAPAKIARRDGVSPHGAPVTLAGVSGAPQEVSDRFATAFAATASQDDIQLADGRKGDYVVRAYLNAYTADAGVTRLSYVFDVFDKSKRRVQRLSDDVGLRGTSADPWSLADDQALKALAERSADDLANALTNTPEAVAANKPSASGGSSGQTSVARSEPAAAQTGEAQASEAPSARSLAAAE